MILQDCDNPWVTEVLIDNLTHLSFHEVALWLFSMYPMRIISLQQTVLKFKGVTDDLKGSQRLSIHRDVNRVSP